MEAPYGYEDWERATRRVPDQASRLDRDTHRLGRPRRARPWIALAVGLLVIAALAAILTAGGGPNSNEAGDGYVVDSP